MPVSQSRRLVVRGARLLASFCLFATLSAFLLQSYVIQSHFHGVPHGSSQVVERVIGNAVPPGKSPFGKSPLDCALCQAYAAVSAVFVPMMPVLPLPLLQVAPLTLNLALGKIPATVRRDGQSRAPPSPQTI